MDNRTIFEKVQFKLTEEQIAVIKIFHPEFRLGANDFFMMVAGNRTSSRNELFKEPYSITIENNSMSLLLRQILIHEGAAPILDSEMIPAPTYFGEMTPEEEEGYDRT